MAQIDHTNAWDFSSGELPYYDQLFKTALRMTRSVHEAEDLLQDTFLKAFRYYSGFEEGTNLKAWLYRIMKNNFISSYRKQRIRPQSVELDEARDSGEEYWDASNNVPVESVEGGILAEEMDEEVARAIDALPHKYKMALILVDLQGHTYQEAADILAVPLGTVMSRLYRGRARIEQALLSYGKRYNYLSHRPAKVRDRAITERKVLEVTTG
ncbi:MAG: sigma-70 family RNA polymerase sigma factor [Acidobacteriota bacterium]